jgi:type II secretory pathway pseudopilin PulG
MTHRRRGFFITDALIGLFLIVALVAALSAATSRQIRSARSLADERKAIRLAERVITQLQRGQLAPQPGTDESIRIDDLGELWTRVTVTVRGRSAELVGRIP